MLEHPFKEQRFKNARRNLKKILESIKEEDLKEFFVIVEKEAMEIHSLMMTSNPSFILMEPNTLKIINEIKNFRSKTGLNLGFTLDAGPNVHFLYCDKDKKVVENFIKEQLKPYCNDIIYDCVGVGPRRLFPNE